MRTLSALTLTTLLAAVAAPAFAQDDGNVSLHFVADEAYEQGTTSGDTSGELSVYNSWLVDDEGRTVYLFSADTQGASYNANAEEGADMPEMSCTSEDCLNAWPPVYVDGELTAGPGIDQRLLQTVEHDGRQVAAYDGWPLYYFSQDDPAGAPQGHGIESFGGTWYVVNPIPAFPGYQ